MLAVAGRVLGADGVFIDSVGDLTLFFVLHRFRIQDEVPWMTRRIDQTEDAAMDTSRLGTELLQALAGRGWSIQRAAAPGLLLPPPVGQRYPRLPADLTAFLEGLEACVNAEETVWFLCPADYRTGEESFRWSECELMSLESADPDAQEQVRAFWNLHFPFMLAVHSDYDYLAVSLADGSYGQIVHGCGPAFEETSLVAPSFAQFLVQLREEAAGIRESYPLSCFL